MASVQFAPTHNHFLDYLVEKATPQEILAYEIPESARERTLELLDKQDDGTLGAEEAEELEQIRQLDLLLMALHVKALRALRSGHDARS
jgi:trans-aconitate methyltransferase